MRFGTMASRLSSIAFLVVSCRAFALERFEAVEPHMGSITRITIYARDDSAIPAAFARIKELDDKLSHASILYATTLSQPPSWAMTWPVT